MKNKAVLFKSTRRYDDFYKKLINYNFDVISLDFENINWIDFNYKDISLIIYFPEFTFSSNHPLSLYKVKDNLKHISSLYPQIHIFPDPKLIEYYSDKYRQYLFLKNTSLPIVPTIPLLSLTSVEQASESFGYPLILKNRYGAGGEQVYKIYNIKELYKFYELSRLNYSESTSIVHFIRNMFKNDFFWHLIRNKKLYYPFISFPLLAQQYLEHDHDLKTVVGFNKVVEAHWRYSGDASSWKMNIDGGGIGVWSYIPEMPINLSKVLANLLQASWLNIDFMCSNDDYYISEFSPVWHHYAFNENSNFIYKEDYNLESLETSLELEEIIVRSYSERINK